MVEYNKAQMGRIVSNHGFVRDTFEKVLRLKEILKFINEHEYLSEHLLLKGGTAINMVVFNLPRLSVDIDWISYRIIIVKIWNLHEKK